MDSRDKLLGIISLSLALFASWFTIGIFALFLQLHVYYVLGASNLIVSLLSTVYFAVNAPSSVLGGYIIDKYGKAKFMLVSSIFILSITGYITPYISNPLILLIMRGFQGYAIAVLVPIVNLLAARYIGAGKGVGTVNTFGSLGFAIAGLIGGFLAKSLSYNFLFTLTGIVSSIALVLLIVIPLRIPSVEIEQRLKFSHISKLAFPIWIIYIAYFLRYTAAGGIWSLFSLFIFSLGGDNLIVGLSQSLNTFTQFLLFKKVGEYSESRGLKVFKIGLLLSAIVFIGYYTSYNAIQILPYQVILGVSWVFIYTGANVYIIENTPEEIQGTALGILNMFNAIPWIIGSTLNGFLSDLLKSYKAYIMIGIILTFISYHNP